MITTSRSWRASTRRLLPHLGAIRYISGEHGVFREGDIVILRQYGNASADPIMTRPLKSAATVHSHKGLISHADIIGKRARDTIKSSSGQVYRIAEATLAEYIRISKRLVTPIYPADAALITSLLDIHVTPPGPEDDPSAPKLEILEAGTGHGALTLYLSRAIHAANPAKPAGMTLLDIKPSSDDHGDDFVSPATNFLLEGWKKERRAVIHSIELKEKYSKHAVKVVRGFRRGIYADNVDFHVGDVSRWLENELASRQEKSGESAQKPFLNYAFLDLPASEQHLSKVASAMLPDGVLIVFNPSITQITEGFRKVKNEDIPLYLDQVLELGTNATTGGRDWDVRLVVPRAQAKEASQIAESDSEMSQPEDSEGDTIGEQSTRDQEQVAAITAFQPARPDVSIVCRPKVGERIIGGGFLGIYRKKAIEL